MSCSLEGHGRQRVQQLSGGSIQGVGVQEYLLFTGNQRR